LNEPSASEPIRIAIRIADPALADRVASALAGIAGIQLVDSEDAPDATIVVPPVGNRQFEHEVQLTSRELEVLALLAEGASNKLIARRLGITTHTAKYHVSSLLDKVDAVSRTDAVALGAKLGMINL
jgi:DNA-binding CsgD family transcriptional regulator